ncbi:protein of unknown function [Burkholderia multivorans]
MGTGSLFRQPGSRAGAGRGMHDDGRPDDADARGREPDRQRAEARSGALGRALHAARRRRRMADRRRGRRGGHRAGAARGGGRGVCPACAVLLAAARRLRPWARVRARDGRAASRAGADARFRAWFHGGAPAAGPAGAVNVPALRAVSGVAYNARFGDGMPPLTAGCPADDACAFLGLRRS